jgi:integrase
MPVDDLWYLARRDPVTGERLKSKRHGRGKRYRVRWIDPQTGEPRAKLFERKALAEEYDANVHADLSRGQWIDPRSGKISVTEYAERWRGDQLHRPATADRVEREFRLHVLPLLGRLQLGQVRASHIRRWVRDRSMVLAPSSLAVVYSDLAAMFNTAIRDRLIVSTPCVDIRLPTIEPADRFVPTPDQVHDLAEALPERYRAIPHVVAGCGTRAGETFGLELDHVDWLQNREVKIMQQVVSETGRKPYLARPKTSTSRRTVELADVTGLALARHIELFPPVEIEVVDEADLRKPVTRPAKILFTDDDGEPLYRRSWSRILQPVARRLGFPERFGLHHLRHMYGSLLVHAGASVKTVQLALGHASPMTTLEIYTHEWPEATDTVRNLVDGVLGQRTRAASSRPRR